LSGVGPGLHELDRVAGGRGGAGGDRGDVGALRDGRKHQRHVDDLPLGGAVDDVRDLAVHARGGGEGCGGGAGYDPDVSRARNQAAACSSEIRTRSSDAPMVSVYSSSGGTWRGAPLTCRKTSAAATATRLFPSANPCDWANPYR